MKSPNLDDFCIKALRKDTKEKFTESWMSVYHLSKMLKQRPNKRMVQRNATLWLRNQLALPSMNFDKLNIHQCGKILKLLELELTVEITESWLIK